MGKRCYIEVDLNKDILWNQIDTIAYNTQLNIYEPVVIQRDKRQYLFFDTENDISLREFFRQNCVTGSFIKELLLNICNTLKEAEAFLLSKNNFMLDAEHIFLDESVCSVKLIYIPVIEDRKFELKRLVSEILFSLAEITEGDMLLTDLREYIKGESVTIDRVSELCSKSGVQSDEAFVSCVHDNDRGITANPEDKKKGIEVDLKWLVPIAGIAVLYCMEFTPMMAHINFAGIYTKNILIGLIAVVEFLFFSVIVFGNKGHSSKNNGKVEKDPFDKTVDLRDLEKPLAFLIEKNSVNPIKSEIAKSEFYIGRAHQVNDLVCKNKVVGKRHAKISIENSKFYITDLDSKNGTFINGAKLSSNQKNEIKNGDVISIVNVNLSFFCL